MKQGTQVATFLFCDQVGSTDLLSRVGTAASEEVRREVFAALRAAVVAARGEEIKNLGDGLMVVFRASSSDAVACAVGMQRAMAGVNAEFPSIAIAIRVGLAVGPAALDEGEDDWFGPPVNVAARLCASAGAGQILATVDVCDVAGWPPDCQHDVGALALKGIPDPVPAREISWEVEPRVPPLGNAALPTALGVAEGVRFVGRALELARLRDAWARVTSTGRAEAVVLVGEPGIGKTRVVREVALAEGHGAVVVYGACGSEDDHPFRPVLDALRPIVAAADDERLVAALGDASADLASVLPSWRARSSPTRVAGEGQLDGVGAAIMRLVGLAERAGPVLLVIDDLHRGTEALCRLLAAMASGRGRILVVACTREDGPLWQRHVSRLSDGPCRLVGLGQNEIAVLLDGASPDLVAQVMATTGGNPAHVLDVRRSLEHVALDVASVHDVRPLIEHTCPYRGLVAYGPDDTGLFFGRDALVSKLVDRLGSSRLLAVLGPSGSGKSSVLLAGLVPAMAAGAQPGSERWPMVVTAPGASPLSSLASALAGLRGVASGPGAIEAELALGPDRLDTIARRVVSGPSDRFVVVVDQFEELFTMADDDGARRTIDSLVHAVSVLGGPVSLVLSLRADFYGHLTQFPALAAAVEANHVLVGPPSAAELVDVVTQPARAAGFRLERGLVDEAVRDATGQSGGLPLLSHALRETWRRRHGRTLTVLGYRESGGVRGSVARTAEAVVAALDDIEREHVRQLCLRLVTPGEGTEDTRRRVPVGELPDPLRRVVPALAAARLVTVDDDYIEVAHEALIREWPRLRSWLDDDRDALRLHRQLTAAASSWSNAGERDHGDLYRGARLVEARGWVDRAKPELNALEQRFLDASLRRNRLEHRRRRMVLSALASLAAVATLAAGFAVVLQQRARDQADRADVQAARADAQAAQAAASATEARTERDAARLATEREAEQRRRSDIARLVAESRSAREDDQALSFLLAREAYVREATPETKGALWSAMIANPRLLRTFTSSAAGVNGLDVSPDGRLLFVGRSDGAVEVRDLDSGRESARYRVGPAAGPTSVASFADGRHVVGSTGGAITVIDLAAHTTTGISTEAVTSGAHDWVQPSADGQRVYAALSGGRLAALDPGGRAPVSVLATVDADIQAISLSPDGRRLAGGTADGRLVVVDLTTGDVDVATIATQGLQFLQIGFSPDGRRIEAGLASGVQPTVTVDVATLTPQPVSAPDLTGTAAGAVSIYATDGARLFTASSRTLYIRDAATGATQSTVDLLGNIVLDIVRSPDGRRLYISELGHTIVEIDIAGDTKVSPRPLRAGPVAFAIASPDGTRLAVRNLDSSIEILDTRTGQALGPAMAVPPGLVAVLGERWSAVCAQCASLSWSPDGTSLAASTMAGEVTILDVATGDARLHLAVPDRPVRSKFAVSAGAAARLFTGIVTWSPHGTTIAAGAWDSVTLFDASTGTPRSTVAGFGDAITSIRFHPDGGRVAVGSFDGTGRILDTRTGEAVGDQLGSGEPYAQDAPFIDWLDDGRTLGISDWKGTRVHFVDATTRAGVDESISLPTTPVAWATDGTTIFVMSLNTYYLADRATGRLIGDPYPAHSTLWASPTADGGFLIGNTDGVRVLDMDPDSWAQRACAIAGRNLTALEWQRYAPAGDPHRTTCPDYPLDA